MAGIFDNFAKLALGAMIRIGSISFIADANGDLHCVNDVAEQARDRKVIVPASQQPPTFPMVTSVSTTTKLPSTTTPACAVPTHPRVLVPRPTARPAPAPPAS